MANTGATFGQEDRAMLMEYLLAKSTFQKRCILCHDLERSLAKKLPYEEWLATVKREVARRPGLLTEEEISKVAGFLTVAISSLTRHHGLQRDRVDLCATLWWFLVDWQSRIS